MLWADWLATIAAHPILLIALGSAVGGNLRYWTGRWIESHAWAAGWPWGTFIVNVSGSLVIGFLATWLIGSGSTGGRELYLLLGTGFCGGYTTFSTFEWETLKLVRDGNWLAAVANAFGSLAAGFLAVLLGVFLATLLLRRF